MILRTWLVVASVFVSGTLCSVPGFSVSRLSAAFVATAGCIFFPSVSAAAICVMCTPRAIAARSAAAVSTAGATGAIAAGGADAPVLRVP